jgi:Ca2+-binding RTX toxin-like protein
MGIYVSYSFDRTTHTFFARAEIYIDPYDPGEAEYFNWTSYKDDISQNAGMGVSGESGIIVFDSIIGTGVYDLEIVAESMLDGATEYWQADFANHTLADVGQYITGYSETASSRRVDIALGSEHNDRFSLGKNNDFAEGGGGNDIIDGGTGADVLAGGFGDDRFYVDNAGDRVQEASNQGNDLVYTTVSYTLTGGQHIELLTTTDLAGTGAINLTGNEFAQTIYGNNGANVINGGGGNDALVGYGGNDTYYVDNAADRVFEAANQGTDTVLTSASYWLLPGQHIEKFATRFLAGTTTINLTGNELAQTISGNNGANVINGNGGDDVLLGYDGNDTLNGAAGADQMTGGRGDDKYYVDNTADKVIEAAGQGDDLVYASISYKLAESLQIETLSATAQGWTVALVGNELSQRINGNDGANTLSGLAGDDTLVGYGANDWLKGELGNDTLYGGAGNDNFVFDTTLNAGTNVDRIMDFSVPADTIYLDNAVMAGLGTTLGTLSAAKFWKSTAGIAHDADDRIIYDIDSGRLLYDGNGNATGGAIHFATLAPNLALTNADFVVF